MGSFRRWATMMKRVHDTHIEGITEEATSETPVPELEAGPKSPEKKRSRCKPAPDGDCMQA
jgi:hypothetical protein